MFLNSLLTQLYTFAMYMRNESGIMSHHFRLFVRIRLQLSIICIMLDGKCGSGDVICPKVIALSNFGNLGVF